MIEGGTWGAHDERGSANHMKPETGLRGIRLVKEGKVYELGRGLEPAMSTVGTRRFGIHTARSSDPTGTSQIRGNEELVVTGLGQVGTQFDALPHIAIGDTLYNCVRPMRSPLGVASPTLGWRRWAALSLGASCWMLPL